MEDYKKKYEETIKKLKEAKESMGGYTFSSVVDKIIPELKEIEDENIRKSIIGFLKTLSSLKDGKTVSNKDFDSEALLEWAAWLEKQGEKNLSTDFSDLRTWKYIVDAVWTEKEGIGQYLDSPFTEETAKKLQKRFGNIEQKPAFCHHEVDFSDCSEEYRKAYYDGWNNCNQQHSQCKSEWNDVVKCLINGMKFYYEDNEEATWGTEKFSMKVKDILSWLEKQGEQKPAWSEEDENGLGDALWAIQQARVLAKDENEMGGLWYAERWLKSLKERMKGK